MPPLEQSRLGIVVPSMPGESIMSWLLRAFQASGVQYEEGMRWLGLDRRTGLGDGDVMALAWALHADADDVRGRMTLLETRTGGRWVHLAGHRLCRWVAPTTMMAKLCPLCLRETGFARIDWLTRAAPACRRHNCSLVQACAACGRKIHWARPGLRICRCGHFFKPLDEAVGTLEPELIAWLEWVEAVLSGDTGVAKSASRRLPALLQDMTLDGAYRLVEAFGLLERPSAPVHDVRHSSVSLSAVGAMLTRGLRRLSEVGCAEGIAPQAFEGVHLPVLAELAEEPSADADGRRAAWLLDVYRAMRPSGVRRVGSRPRRQIPLFL
jgi:hypothetical protein